MRPIGAQAIIVGLQEGPSAPKKNMARYSIRSMQHVQQKPQQAVPCEGLVFLYPRRGPVSNFTGDLTGNEKGQPSREAPLVASKCWSSSPWAGMTWSLHLTRDTSGRHRERQSTEEKRALPENSCVWALWKGITGGCHSETHGNEG